MSNILDLKTAARNLIEESYKSHWYPEPVVAALEAALAAEEAKPKVEREGLWRHDISDPTVDRPKWLIRYHDLGYDIIAERPLPTEPAQPSIEERLKTARGLLVAMDRDDVRELLDDALTEINRLKEEVRGKP